MPYRDLPEFAEFWRRDDPSKWAREGPGVVAHYSLSDCTKVSPELDSDEVVLLAPNWCPECKSELPFPLPVRCPHCGDELPERAEPEKLRAMIREWSGTKYPHI